MQYLYGLDDQHDHAELGGKGAALAKMLQAGFAVPEGFVISAEAYPDMPPELAASILKAFDNLASPFVAVRSSATSEDSAEAAWAGQLDTFLYVDRDDLINKITACWDSINSERARAYAGQRSLAAGPAAVVVQRMVPSEVSGVAFSAHPVTQSRDHIVIEACLGLGEALVSGQITPDTYIVHKTSAEPLQKYITRQTKKLMHDGQKKTTWVDLDATEGSQQKLTEHYIKELATTVQKLEQYFGHPVDVEWAVAGSTLYILQSRPITTLAVH